MQHVKLLNQHMGVRHDRVPEQPQPGTVLGPDDPPPPLRDLWTLVLTDRALGNTVEITFDRETRDDLVRQLTGGIVLAGGDLPRI
jgi:hypothetical protein